MIQLEMVGENKIIYVTPVNNRLYSYGKSNSLTKMKRWRNFTHDGLLATEKIVGHAYFRGEIYFTVFIGLYECNYYLIFP